MDANAAKEAVLNFPEWSEVLDVCELPEREKESARFIIRWFLRFCQRGRVSVTNQSAQEFIEFVRAEKDPSAARLEEWKEGVRWFFRTAKERGAREEGGGTDGLEERVRRKLRAGRYSYRTEQSYLGWIRRFLGAHRGRSIESIDDNCIRDYLSGLAATRVSASTQRQALNSTLSTSLFEQWNRSACKSPTT